MAQVQNIISRIRLLLPDNTKEVIQDKTLYSMIESAENDILGECQDLLETTGEVTLTGNETVTNWVGSTNEVKVKLITDSEDNPLQHILFSEWDRHKAENYSSPQIYSIFGRKLFVKSYGSSGDKLNIYYYKLSVTEITDGIQRIELPQRCEKAIRYNVLSQINEEFYNRYEVELRKLKSMPRQKTTAVYIPKCDF